MDVSEAKRLKTLEDENARLKKLLADAILDNSALKHRPLSERLSLISRPRLAWPGHCRSSWPVGGRPRMIVSDDVLCGEQKRVCGEDIWCRKHGQRPEVRHPGGFRP
jgi:putative transposase